MLHHARVAQEHPVAHLASPQTRLSIENVDACIPSKGNSQALRYRHWEPVEVSGVRHGCWLGWVATQQAHWQQQATECTQRLHPSLSVASVT